MLEEEGQKGRVRPDSGKMDSSPEQSWHLSIQLWHLSQFDSGFLRDLTEPCLLLPSDVGYRQVGTSPAGKLEH